MQLCNFGLANLYLYLKMQFEIQHFQNKLRNNDSARTPAF